MERGRIQNSEVICGYICWYACWAERALAEDNPVNMAFSLFLSLLLGEYKVCICGHVGK